jgi:hypothetical protein
MASEGADAGVEVEVGVGVEVEVEVEVEVGVEVEVEVVVVVEGVRELDLSQAARAKRRVSARLVMRASAYTLVV